MSDGDRGNGSQNLGAFGLVAAFILIGVVCAVVGYSVALDRLGREHAPHQHEISAQNNAESACAGLQSRALFECIYDEVSASHQAANSEQDLEAQQTMARWTWVLGFTGLIALVITGAGVYFVAGTLKATEKAVRETVKATIAMDRQNAITKEGSRTQTRAYVYASGAKIVWRDGRAHIKIRLTNSGLTPAKEVRTISRVTRRLTQKPSPQTIDAKDLLRNGPYLTKDQSDWFHIYSVEDAGAAKRISDGLLEAAKGHFRVGLIGEVRSTTIFGERIITPFRFFANVKKTETEQPMRIAVPNGDAFREEDEEEDGD